MPAARSGAVRPGAGPAAVLASAPPAIQELCASFSNQDRKGADPIETQLSKCLKTILFTVIHVLY